LYPAFQAAAEQAGFGLLELENLDVATVLTAPFGSIESTAKD
jgi:hypothetical protein